MIELWFTFLTFAQCHALVLISHFALEDMHISHTEYFSKTYDQDLKICCMCRLQHVVCKNPTTNPGCVTVTQPSKS